METPKFGVSFLYKFMNSKHCPKCKQDKPMSEWGVSRKSHDGLTSYCKECRLKIKRKSRRQQKWNAGLKLKVIRHYSNEIARCSWCGYADIRALCVDHVNNDDIKHSCNIYSWLFDNDYPTGFQVFCLNCDWIKRQEYNDHMTGDSRLSARPS
jgi:hypothetical protein